MIKHFQTILSIYSNQSDFGMVFMSFDISSNYKKNNLFIIFIKKLKLLDPTHNSAVTYQDMNCGMWNDVCVDHWWQMYVTLNHRENSVTHHYSDVWSNSPWIFIRNHGRDDWIHTSLYNVLLCLEINGAMWTGHENSRSIMFSKSGSLHANWDI